MKNLIALLSLFSASFAWADVALVGTPDTTAGSGTTYTCEAGSNRVCIWALGVRESAGPANVTSPLLGATTMNIRAQEQTATTNNHHILINDVLHASIPGGSQTLSATISGGSNGGAAFTLSGVDQAVPHDTSVAEGNSTSAAVPTFDVVAGGIAILVVQAQSSVTGTPSGYTLIADNLAAGTAEFSVAYKLITATGTETPTWTVGSATWLVAAVSYAPATATPPAFDTNPALSDSCTSTACTFTYDADAVADEIHAMLTDTAAAAPTCAAIEAETGSHGANGEASTGAADSITLTSIDGQVFPLYDAHFCLEEGTSNYGTVVTVSDVLMAAPTGKQFVAITSVGVGSPCEDFNTAVNPDIVNGDYLRANSTTAPGSYALSISAACQFSYSGNGSQQTALDTLVYDASAGAYHVDDIDFVDNNSAPFCETDTLVYDFTEDAAISAINLALACSDPDGDTMTFAVTSGTLPVGLSLSSAGSLTGTPTTENEAGVAITVTATDAYSDTDTLDLYIYILNTITLPNYAAGNLTAAIALHQDTFPWQLDELELVATFACSDVEAANEVISQNPAAATEVTAYQEIGIVVSTGICASGVGEGSIRRRRR